MPRSSLSRYIACVLDTDISIDFLRHKDYARALLAHWSRNNIPAVSTITHLEIFRGLKQKEVADTRRFLDGLVSLPVDVYIARQAGALLQQLCSRGITIDMPDAVIAVTALYLDVPLLTNNVNHYPVPGLNLVRGLDFSY